MQKLHALKRHTLGKRLMQENRKVYYSVHVKTHIAFAINAGVVGTQEQLEKVGGQLNKHCDIGNVKIEVLSR